MHGDGEQAGPAGEPVGVGLIGYGVAGSVFHAPLVQAEPGLRLVAVASGRPERVRRDHPQVRVVGTPAELLDDPAVELVVVAAPNTLHFELTGLALRAGRHVVVDKPFVNQVAEADELIRLATTTGRLLSVFHNRRWDADYRTVRRCIQAGLLGRVSTYIARYDRFRPQFRGGWREQDRPGSGVLFDLGAHLVDQALQLFGLPETVLADVRGQRPDAATDDYAHLVLGYGALRAILHAGSLVRLPGPRFEVHGDKGSFVKHGLDPQEEALRLGRRPGEPGWGVEAEARHGTLATDAGGLLVTGTLASEPGAYETFYRQMARAVRGEAGVPVRPEEARDTIRVLEAALAASRDGRVVTLR